MKLSTRDLDILQSFFSNQPVKKAYLFGSRVKDTSAHDSDIDVLVELDARVDLLDFITIQQAVSSLLPFKVDLVSAKGLHPSIAKQINNEKVLIYARESG